MLVNISIIGKAFSLEANRRFFGNLTEVSLSREPVLPCRAIELFCVPVADMYPSGCLLQKYCPAWQ